MRKPSNNIHHVLIIIALMLCGTSYASAQTVQDSVTVHFRQSRTALDTSYMDNARQFSHARATIEKMQSPDSALVLTSITVSGGASPEGTARFNRWLSEHRAERISNWFEANSGINDSTASFTFLGADWNGLRRMVLSDSNVPSRQRVLSILDDISDPTMPSRLRNLDGGVPYRYMYRKLYPSLRESRIVLTFERKAPRIQEIEPEKPELKQYPMPAVPEILTVELPRERKPFYMGLKTNLLADLLAVPSIGAEFYLGRNFSIVGNWMYGWWDTDRTHRYWRIYGGDIVVRRWFGSKAAAKPLTGHHAGVYAGVVTYDFEWGGTGYMGGIPGRTLWDRCNWYVGAEYGYSLPLHRRLNLDFSIGIGYLGGKYIVYDPEDRCYVYRETRRRRWFGPTKAEVSLVWLIGRGNYNRGKGGRK